LYCRLRSSCSLTRTSVLSNFCYTTVLHLDVSIPQGHSCTWTCLDNKSLCCSCGLIYIYCRGLCCTLTRLHCRGLLCSNCLDNITGTRAAPGHVWTTAASKRCLLYRGLSCIWTCIHLRVLSFCGKIL
jgi:hypothetical protein